MLQKLSQKEGETFLPSESISTHYRPIFFTAQWAFFKSPLGYLVHYCTLHLEPSYNRRAACVGPGGQRIRGIYILSCSSHFHYRFLHKMRGSDAKSTAGLMLIQRGQNLSKVVFPFSYNFILTKIFLGLF